MSSERIFGPVPSRRLGRSIGINNIPPKICSYSCVYCQIGFSLKMIGTPQPFYPPEELAAEAEEKLKSLSAKGEQIDYLTIVPDGEPTLDSNLGRLIDMLKKTGIKIAVITNSTMLNLASVREALNKADWVSVKVDSIDEEIWRKIDKPIGSIDFADLIEGIVRFSSGFNGQLACETMLVKGLNDSEKTIKMNAEFLQRLNPDYCYLSIPTRPPADKTVKPPEESEVNKAYQIYSAHNLPVEYLIGYEGNKFSSTGNVSDDILSITSVHPMREDAVKELLEKNGTSFSVIEKLIKDGLLKKTNYNNKNYYLRRLRS